MPKFIGGTPPFVGTRDNLTIYLMNGEYIIRTKTSLTGKRVKRDPAFAKTMKYAGWLKQGARIASHIYRQIPADERVYEQYRELTGKAMSLLKEGFNAGDVITMLEAVYLSQSMNNITGKEPDGHNKCSEYQECCSEQTGGTNSGNNSDYSNEYNLNHTGKSNGRYVKCNREQIRSYTNSCSYSRSCSCSYNAGDKFNSKRHHECRHLRIRCGSKYNSKGAKSISINTSMSTSMNTNTNTYMNRDCLAIIGETGHGERCRWESLALVL